VSALKPTEAFGRFVDNPALGRLAEEVEEPIVRALTGIAAAKP